MKHRGFTLIEAVIALGVLAILMAFTLPTFAGRLAHARRADATLALERVQIAQERHRTLHGLYAHELHALNASTRSPDGLYDLALEPGPGDGYTATASARADGLQANDTACDRITLRVEQGFATLGPTPRCWNR